MPIYEYHCGACGHTTEILHGINDPAPTFCPECGVEGSMRKGFAPPAIVFKGSGWAKKDRSSGSRTKAAAKDESGSDSGKATADSGRSKSDAGSTTSSSASGSTSTSSSAD
jgi:putative FmdB family regulatory protein